MKPNYGRDRAERERAARTKKQEKLQEKQDRLLQRRAGEADATSAPEDDAEAGTGSDEGSR